MKHEKLDEREIRCIDWEKVMMFILILMIISIPIIALVKYKPVRRSKPEDNQDDQLVYITRNKDDKANTYIYYDKDTKVMYMINYHGGITVMVNPDGTPKLYEDGDPQ